MTLTFLFDREWVEMKSRAEYLCHYAMLYPQNGDRIVAIDSNTQTHTADRSHYPDNKSR